MKRLITKLILFIFIVNMSSPVLCAPKKQTEVKAGTNIVLNVYDAITTKYR